jgi:hypothetical protein
MRDVTAKPRSPRWLDLSGQRFGRLIAIDWTSGVSDGCRVYRCRCDCGQETRVRSVHLTSRRIKSCGCLFRDTPNHTTHGRSKTAEYRCWAHILSRCLNPNVKEYARYGGRGITVCDQWLTDFPAFLADMGPRPSSAHSIDRIDNDGNYEPGNCRWAMRTVQSRNRSTNTQVMFRGRLLTIAEAAEASGLSPLLISLRKRRGWPEDELFLAPDPHRPRPRRK